MAAFCTCCGAAITSKSERCAVCGAPSHGMTNASTVGQQQEVIPTACKNTVAGCKHLPASKPHLTAWK